MTREYEAEKSVSELISEKRVGEKVRIEFKGLPSPVTARFEFSGGWIVEQKLHPGMPLEFIKGDPEHLKNLTITIEPYDGLK
ncbi:MULTISPECIES: hypothetical protein [Pseudomonas]|uniref:hypothetical protein n=1 Tax=Pseudomonas TaxID=286 RepID=UPI000EF6712D|nr:MULTISPECIES: hypothetical protein [Pseudomonas]AYN09538.1 hypothetical protein CHN49_06670 [Pseudomonas putida]MBC3496178.1 hypothetical protein [Pseudomonas sp. SWRI67]MBV4525428.1 hypothetical protein [Pseudomonas kermanshahensis]